MCERTTILKIIVKIVNDERRLGRKSISNAEQRTRAMILDNRQAT
jgi:hypothetical protein